MYTRLEKHKLAMVIARKKGLEVLQYKKEIRIKEYNQNPKLCLCCGTGLPYKDHKRKKFCNLSCAAKITNKGKVKDEAIREKIKNTLRKRFPLSKKKENKPRPIKLKTKKIKNIKSKKKEFKLILGVHYSRVEFPICTGCGERFCCKVLHSRTECRKTCSDACKIHACVGKRTYRNGSRKLTKYFNRWESKEVTLESSWEVKVAELLDSKNIKWIRPSYIKWIDDNKKQKNYYPDFYLKDYDTYLDPKNPYCMEQDKRKMEIVSKQIKLVFGPLEKIVEFINNIK